MTDKGSIQKAANRVKQMEACFDALQQAALQDKAIPAEHLQLLVGYYESGQWLEDYELDEMGLLPQDLKRGILAQDAVYDFLDQIKHAK